MEEISQVPEIASFHSVTVTADFIVSVYLNMILSVMSTSSFSWRLENTELKSFHPLKRAGFRPHFVERARCPFHKTQNY